MAADLRVDADFPGGNIVVEEIAGDTIRVHQDLRDTPIWWFYWALRLHGGAGRTVRFVFTNRDVCAALGPAVSTDGDSWQWLGREACTEDGFAFAVPAGRETTWLAFCPLYTTRHLEAFLARQSSLERRVLCVSEGDRPVPHLVLPAAEPRQRVLLTARHHACETMASFVLEGILSFATGDEPAAQALRRHTELHAVPLVDVDGVERGDQGKARAPHDHNRDYLPEPRYAAVRALMAELGRWPAARPLMLDLHCPWIRKWRNEDLYMVANAGTPAAEAERFHDCLDQAQRGPLRCDRRHFLPFGVDWNVESEGTSAGYCSSSFRLAMALEVPYALATGVTVTPATAREFGVDLGRALAAYVS